MHCDREPDSPQHPRGLGISGEPMQPTAHSTKPPFGKETAPNDILRLSASITVTFSNHLHASIHLAEPELNRHPHLWSQGFEWKCSTIRLNIRFSISLMTVNKWVNRGLMYIPLYICQIKQLAVFVGPVLSVVSVTHVKCNRISVA